MVFICFSLLSNNIENSLISVGSMVMLVICWDFFFYDDLSSFILLGFSKNNFWLH